MQIETHTQNRINVAEVISDAVVIHSLDDALDLLGNMGYQGFQAIVLRTEHFTPAFFDLKTGLAGEILQKFSTYQMRLVIVGDLSMYQSKSLHAFIVESNRSRQVNFVNDLHEALSRLSSASAS